MEQRGFSNNSLTAFVICTFLAAFSTHVRAAGLPETDLPLAISAPGVAPGSIAQIRVTLNTPHRISRGSVVMDFDPAVFGPVIAVDVFSAAGDQYGRASIAGLHVDAQFNSESGGIGRLPRVPLLTVTLPVLPGASASGSISLTTSSTPWKDVDGNRYGVTRKTAQFKPSGALSIDSVTPGGGILPAGTQVRIAGRGFTPSTAIRIEGAVVDSKLFIGPQAIDVVVGAPTDLTGKRVVALNPDGAETDFYPALRGAVTSIGDGDAGSQLIFPQQTYAGMTNSQGPFALQNPTLEPVDVRLLYTISTRPTVVLRGYNSATIPPGGTLLFNPRSSPGISASGAIAGKPLRMLTLSGQLISPQPAQSAFLEWEGGRPTCSTTPPSFLIDAKPCWVWLSGTPAPSKNVSVSVDGLSVQFSLAVSTADGRPWLKASPQGNVVCSSQAKAPCAISFALTPDPELPPGEYVATLTATADLTAVLLPATTSLTYRVAQSIIAVPEPLSLYFTADAGGDPPAPLTFQVTSTGAAAPFSVKLRDAINGEFVKFTPSSGLTPATVTVTADPSVVKSSGALNYTVVQGPSNDVVIQTMLNVRPPFKIEAIPEAVAFWAKPGSNPPPQQVRFYNSASPWDGSVVTSVVEGPSAWLAASLSPNTSTINVTVDTTGLSPGTYRGIVSIASPSRPDYAPKQVPVTLVVWTGPPAVVVDPANVELTGTSGPAYPQTQQLISVSSDGMAVGFTASASTEDGNGWISVTNAYPFEAPNGSAYVVAKTSDLPPGTYHGTVSISAPQGNANAIDIPVTLHVTPAVPSLPRPGPPLAISVVNAASQTQGAIAPGEIITILGLNIGPPKHAGIALDESGKVATNLATARVLFNDVPAPLLYASSTQVNAVVPFEVAGTSRVSIAVEFDGNRFILGATVAQSAPAIFTADGTGTGQASIFNQDSSVNSPSSPSARGSRVRIIATGLGQTLPAGVTGEIIREAASRPLLPLKVQVGGADAAIQQVSPVPDQVAGVYQLDVVVPLEAPTGPEVPVVLISGDTSSPRGVTLSIK